jgi:hypothetical protein
VPSMTITNEPITLSDAIAKANSLYGLGLPLLKDLPSGTTLYAMWQISVTIQQPGPKSGELMVINATENFLLFGGLAGGVTLTVVQGDAKRMRPTAKLEIHSLNAKHRPRASRSRR